MGKFQRGSLQPVLDRLPILQSVGAMARAVIGCSKRAREPVRVDASLMSLSPRKIESRFWIRLGLISCRFVTVELSRFLVNSVRQRGVLIHFPQLAPSRSPRTHLRQCTEWNPPPSLQRWRSERPPPRRPRTEMIPTF
jgi:hypothetical protein